ncbi:MAG: hypothetical protein EB078_07900 [Proteobacteria bacterium]|nr:hypothetical protein [Pseudomonadota bacterium]
MSWSSFAQTELSVTKFRFQKYVEEGFERLVIEFSGSTVSKEVVVKPNASSLSGRDLSLVVTGATLVGAIPESSINESYLEKQSMMGPLAFDTESPKNGFSIRTLIKNKQHEIDAFWLANPTRLTIDVFKKDSARAASRSVLENRVASKTGSQSEGASAERALASASMNSSAAKSKSVPKQPSDIFCFPAKSKISAKVGFQAWNGSDAIRLKVPAQPNLHSESNDDIVCFPAQARMTPQLDFAAGSAGEIDTPATTGRTPSSEKPKFDPRTSNVPAPSTLGVTQGPPQVPNPASLLPPF